MKYVSRAEWGAAPPRKTPTKLVAKELRGIAVHYEGADSSKNVDHAVCAGRVRNIQKFHQNTRGWNDIAYSWLVCRHGVIFEGRGWGIRTAANGTDEGNDGYHAVCYLDDDDPAVTDLTAEADAAMGDVVRHTQHYGHGTEVRPHSSFKPTGCPGQELRDWVTRGGWLPPAPQAPEKAPSSPPAAPAPAPGTPGTPAWYKRVLKVAAPMLRGNDVKVVQTKIRATADGVYGPNTAAKVRGWQALHGLTADGIVGPKTARKLEDC